MKRTDFTLGLGAVDLGVGSVERNTVVNITILSLENNWRQQRINTIHVAVLKRAASNKRSIAKEDTQVIAQRDGKFIKYRKA